MATRDFSRVPGSQLDRLYRIAKDQPHLIPNAEERAAIIAEWEGRPAGASWGDPQPDNVAADLEASATPITPDPVVKPKAAPKSAPPAPAPKTGAQRLADVNAQSGLLPGQSMEDFAREHRAAMAQQREEHMADVMARRRAGEQDPDQAAYNAETGVLGDTSLPPMDGYNEVTREYNTPRAPLHPMIARDRVLEQQHTEQTAAAIGKKYGPEAEALYRDGLRRGVLNFDAVRSPAEKEANARWAQIENDARMSPDPEVRKAAQDELDARDKRRTTGEQADNQRRRSADLKAEKDARLAHWRAMTMLAGGSQNINAGNRGMFSQLAMLSDQSPAGGGLSPRQQQIAYALPGGRERAAVDAAHNRQLTEIGLRVATGRGFQDMTPEQQQAFGLQAQNAAAQQAAGIQQDAQALVNERADSVGWNNLLTRILGGGVDGWDNTLLTIAEEEEAIRKLMAKYPHLTYEQARQHVEAAASGKTRQPRNAPPPPPRETETDAGSMPAVSA